MTDAQLLTDLLWWLGICAASCFAFALVLIYDDKPHAEDDNPPEFDVDLWEQALQL